MTYQSKMQFKLLGFFAILIISFHSTTSFSQAGDGGNGAKIVPRGGDGGNGFKDQKKNEPGDGNNKEGKDGKEGNQEKAPKPNDNTNISFGARTATLVSLIDDQIVYQVNADNSISGGKPYIGGELILPGLNSVKFSYGYTLTPDQSAQLKGQDSQLKFTFPNGGCLDSVEVVLANNETLETFSTLLDKTKPRVVISRSDIKSKIWKLKVSSVTCKGAKGNETADREVTIKLDENQTTMDFTVVTEQVI